MLKIEIGLGVPRGSAGKRGANGDRSRRGIYRFVNPTASAKEVGRLIRVRGNGVRVRGTQIDIGTHRAALVSDLEESEGCGVISKVASPRERVVGVALERAWTVCRQGPRSRLAFVVEVEERFIESAGRVRRVTAGRAAVNLIGGR